MAIVLDMLPGSEASPPPNRERDIRKRFVEHMTVEAVVCSLSNFFLQHFCSWIVLFINRAKGATAERFF